MLLSNDGVNYGAEEAFVAGKSWILSQGEGVKTVYVRFRDRTNTLHQPVATSITMGIKDGMIPGTHSYLTSALTALQFASGMAVPDDLDLAHADVAPYAGGAANPDNKIDGLDVFTILLRAVGQITAF